MSNGLNKGVPGTISFLENWATQHGWSIDGVRADEVTAQGIKCPKTKDEDRDYLHQSREIFAVVFSHFNEYTKTLQNTQDDPFKKIGLDLSWIQADPSGKDLFQVSEEFISQLQQEFLGDRGTFRLKADEYFSKFAIARDQAQNGVEVVRYVWGQTQFRLAPFQEQKDLIDQYVDSLKLEQAAADHLKHAMKTELGRLRLGNTLAKVVAQDAALQAIKLDQQAQNFPHHLSTLETKLRSLERRGEKAEAKKLRKQIEAEKKSAPEKFSKVLTLFELALELDPKNALAHRGLSHYLYHSTPADLELAKSEAIEAIRNENSQMGQLELISMLEYSGDPKLSDAWKFFDEKMNLLNRGEQLVVLHRAQANYYKGNDKSEYSHLKAAYLAGDKDPTLVDLLFQKAPTQGDFEIAVQTGQVIHKKGFASESERSTFEMKLADFAVKANDPLLAHRLLTNGSETVGDFLNTPTEKRDALMRLYQDPHVWMNAAEAAAHKGDFVATETLVQAAIKLNDGRLCWETAPGQTLKLVFVEDYYSKKTRDDVYQGELEHQKIVNGTLIPTDPAEYTQHGRDRKVISRIADLSSYRAANDYLPRYLERKLDESIQETSQQLYTATGPSLEEAYSLLRFLESGKAAMNMANFLEFGLGENEGYLQLKLSVGDYAEKVLNWDSKTSIELKAVYQDVEKQFKTIEDYVSSHPELAEFLEPHFKLLKQDMEILRKDSESIGRKQFSDDLKKLKEHLVLMGEPGAKHLLDSVPILQDTRIKIASGLVNNNIKLLNEGVADLNSVLEYTKLDQKKREARQGFGALQPSSSTLAFDLVLDPNDPKVKKYAQSEEVSHEASFETLKKSPLWKAKEAFKDEDPAAYQLLLGIAADQHASASGNTDYYSNYLDKPYGKTATIADLRKLNDKLRVLYGGPETGKLLNKIVTRENEENLKENSGFKVRQEFGEAMAAYQDFAGIDKSFSVLEANQFQGVTSEQLSAVRDFYVQRWDSYEKFLQAEIKRAHDEEAKIKPKPGQLKPKVGPKELVAQMAFNQFKMENQMSRLKLQSLDTGDLQESIKVLRETGSSIRSLEEKHLEGMLTIQIEMVKAIPSDSTVELDKVVQNFGYKESYASGAEKLKFYSKLQTEIDACALLQSVRAKKKMMDAMADEVGTTDKILHYLPGEDVNSKPTFLAEVKKYEEIETLLKSGDPADVAKGRTWFIEMEQAGRQIGLKREYKWASYYNQFTVGVGIVLAAAATGGAAAGAVGVLGGGTIAQGLAMATVFTLSSRVYHAAIYDGETVAGAFAKIAKDPLGFGEEVLLNWAMFGAIGKANQVFMGFFEKGVQEVAVKNLVAKGLLEEGTKITEELLAKNPALKAALGAEASAVRQGFFTMALQKGGQFATEVLAFQGWEFGMANYQMIKKGEWSGKGFLHSFEALSPDRIIHGALFLLALKGGGALSAPFKAKFSEMALGRLESKFNDLQVEVDAVEKQAVLYFEKGEGDIATIIKRYKELALKRKALLEKIPPELLNPSAKLLNDLYLQQIAHIEAGIGPWDKIFGYGNEFGLKTNEKGMQSFTDAKGPLLVKSLTEHPWIKDVTVYGNGVIEFHYIDPMNGQKTRFQVLPEGEIKRQEVMAMQDATLAKLEAQWGSSDAKQEQAPSRGDKTANYRLPNAGQELPMAAQPAEALAPKVDTGLPLPDHYDINATTGTLQARSGEESIGMNFADKVFQKVTLANVTLLIHEAKGENGKTVYKMTYLGPKNAVQIWSGRSEKNVPPSQYGKGSFEINLKDGDVIFVNGKDYTFYKPEVSTREVRARELLETVKRYRDAKAQKASQAGTAEKTVNMRLPQRPLVLEQNGKPVRQGDALLEGPSGTLVVDTQGRIYEEIPGRKGNLLFFSDVNPQTKQVAHYLRFFGEAGVVQVQKGGKGTFETLEPGGKYGQEKSPRHELKDGDVLLVNGEKFTYRSHKSLRKEGETRAAIQAEKANLDSELKLIQGETESPQREKKYQDWKAREKSFQEMLAREKRSIDGVPFAEVMAQTSRSVAGSVFDGKVTIDGKEKPLFKEDGSVDPAVRRKLRDEMVYDLFKKGVTLSSDAVKSGEELNTVAIDSMIDLALTAKNHGIIDQPGGLSRGQFFRLMNELYLHQSPALRISGVELTHVPMVVEGTLGFLEGQNPHATPSDKRVAFVTALLHDGGKWDPDLKTQKGYTIQPHPFLNPTGKAIEVRSGESFSEALQRYQSEGKLSTEERGKIKMPGDLISVLTHHDAKSVHDMLAQLENEGLLQRGEAAKVWNSIERHGMVSSWILNNSFGGIGVLSGVFTQTQNKAFVDRYMELANRLIKGEKVDLSPDTLDPRVLELRKIFKNDFNELDRAMLLGDHQGQIDVAKYMSILSSVPANKEATIWQLLLGGSPTNSVNGVIQTHTQEQRLLLPELGDLSAVDFQKANAWLAQMDPSKPGLAQALMANSATQRSFELWVKAHPDAAHTVEAWLKSEKIIGEDGKPSENFQDIKSAVEKSFYDGFFIDKQDSLFGWEQAAKEKSGNEAEIVLSDKELEKMVVEEEHVLTDKDMPQVTTPDVMRARIADAFSLIREFNIPFDSAYLKTVGRAAATHPVTRAEAKKIFQAIDAGLSGVSDFAAYGIARRALFIEVLEGRMSWVEAKNLGKSILEGEVRIILPEIQMEVAPSIAYERPFEIEIVVPQEQAQASREAHIQRAFSATGGDPMNDSSVQLRGALNAALEKGTIRLSDLDRVAGIHLEADALKQREVKLDLPRNRWLSEFAKNPQKFLEKLETLEPGADVISLDSKRKKTTLASEPAQALPLAAQPQERETSKVETEKPSPPTDKGPTNTGGGAAAAVTIGLGILFSPDVAQAAGQHVQSTSDQILQTGLVLGILGGFAGLMGYLWKRSFAPAHPVAERSAVPEKIETRPVEAKPVVVPEPVVQAPIESEFKISQNSDGSFGSFAGTTHRGEGKEVNEDTLLAGKDYAVVFDGMGGMKNGVEAARLAREVVQKHMAEHGDLKRALIEAGDAINDSPYYQGGAVAAGYKIIRNADGSADAVIVHAGDSVAYVIDPDAKLVRHRSRDQSMVEGMFRPEGAKGAHDPVTEGGVLPITPPHAPNIELGMRANTNSNVVYGGLGVGNVTKPIVTVVHLKKGEKLVLVSDGVSDNLSSQEILELAKGNARESEQKIFNAAFEKMQRLKDVQEVFQQRDAKKLKNPHYRPKSRIPWTGPKGESWWIDRQNNIYDAAKGGKLKDHVKLDNLTVLVYEHNVATVPVHELPTRIEIPMAAQPAEPLSKTSAPDTLFGTSAPGDALLPGAYPILNGHIDASRIPSHLDSFDIYVGKADSVRVWDRPVVIVDEMMGDSALQGWAHVERTPTGYKVQNQRPSGTLFVVVNGKPQQLEGGRSIELGPRDELQIGSFNNFTVTERGDLVMDNALGMQMGGEIVIP